MAARAKRKGRPRPSRQREPAWVGLSNEQLLSLRFCDLGLTLRGTRVERHFADIQRRLERRGIRCRPHLWLSEEWFSPDGVPGIAVPFYMAHPRLMRLERRLMHEAEGGNATWLTRILRHELGHALDNAFRLRRRKSWRSVFGRASRPYPDVYRPRPASRDFVLHLGRWYAQSHPTEDFAETFAVWMQPKARWRHDYQGWPALRKLEYVDALMDELRGEPPPVVNRSLFEPLDENRQTLREHYRLKCARYEIDRPDAYDRRLKRVFGRHRRDRRRLRASTFLRQSRPQLERWLMRRSRLHPYLVQHVVSTVIQRCHELDLVLDTSQREVKRVMLGILERILLDILRRDRERYHL
ncbi:MAG TPA: putative zinc-binding metallopeptidase [Thermoanaerobaculia bacterium]|nr:putative zinc-binding metallopeptidase [Thermoanaerobaculia bacterium]